MPLRPGDTALVQEVYDGRVWAARPMRVVHDEPDLVVLWFPRGTTWQRPTPPPSRGHEPTRGERLSTSLLLGDWVFADTAWDTDTLQLWRPGDWRATWVSWLPSGEHWGWYVNLQLPFERTTTGLRTMDLALDVIVDPDYTWHYKDEDEFELFLERGVFDAETGARTRAGAERAIADAEARRWPFGERWQDWRPGAGWQLPELPEGWHECR